MTDKNSELLAEAAETVCPSIPYRGRTLAEIAEEDPEYLIWAMKTTGWGNECAAEIARLLDLPAFVSASSSSPSDDIEEELTPHRIALQVAKTATCPLRKFRGATICEIAREEPGYLRWARANTDWGYFQREAIRAALHQLSLDKLAGSPPPTLAPDQQVAFDKLIFGFQLGYRILRLFGGAGVGKSYTVEALARYFTELDFEVHGCAVSYVASEILRRHLDPVGASCATLARTLRFDKRWEDGQEVYSHSYRTPAAIAAALDANRVLIVDECSMVRDEDANAILEALNETLDSRPEHAGVLILVGDDRQLPPVKQSVPSAFCTYNVPTRVVSAELTVPMRYEIDSHLHAVERLARATPRALLEGPTLAGRTSTQVTEVRTFEELIEHYVENFRFDNAALHRVLLFRRRDVVDTNNRIRFLLFGANPRAVEEDEQLMILSTTDHPFKDPDPETGYTDNIRYYSGVGYRVDSIDEDIYEIDIGETTYRIPHYVVQFTGRTERTAIIFGIDEVHADHTRLGGAEYEAAVNAAIAFGQRKDANGKRIGSWRPFRILKGDLVLVAYTYASSVHRCQGQSLDYAYVAPRPLLEVRPPMGPALTYVACTRARKHLTVLR